MNRSVINEHRRLLIKGSVGTLMIKSTSMGLSFLVSLLLARLLGAEEYGSYVYLLAVVGLLGIFGLMGFDKLLVRNISAYAAYFEWGRIRGLLRRSYQVVSVFSLTLMVCAGVIGWLIADNSSGLLPTFWIALLILPLITLTRARQSVMQGFQRIVLGQLPEMVISPLLFLVLILSVFVIGNARATSKIAIELNILALTAGLIAATYLSRKVMPHEVRDSAPVFETRLWLKSIAPLILISGMILVNSHIDIIMLKVIAGSSEAGIYAVANRGAELITYVLLSVNTAFAPIISRLHVSKEISRLQREVTYSARIVLVFSFMGTLILILFGHWFLLLFGEAFISGRTALTILSIGQLINAAAGSVGLLLIMSGNENVVAIGIGIGVVTNVILNSLLIPVYKMEGSAIATVASIIIWNIILAVLVWRKLGLNPTAFRLKK
ncbi:MAG: flippase [Nitrospirota bacterium]|nr:MAG: flippase [Nitrospirota bacterium]